MQNFLYNNFLAKQFFKKYFCIDREVFRITKTSISYWVDKGSRIAECRLYGKFIFDTPIIKKIKYASIVALLFLKNPVAFFILDTDNTATNNKDCSISGAEMANNNDGSAQFYYIENTGSRVRRILMDWTLPAGSGVILKIELNLYFGGDGNLEGKSLTIHELTQAFVEAEATWNIYSTGNSWASAGGDYSATVIDTSVVPAATNFTTFVLQGTGAENPLSLNWGDTVDLLIKGNESVVQQGYFRSKEWGTANQRPYILITFSPAGPAGRSQGVII
jgi:hypothetical protein